MVRRHALILAFALGLASIASSAQAQIQLPLPNLEGTPEEQQACRSDSTRYCKQFEPDQLAVLRCLQANRTKISRACVKVLESHGQ